MLNSNHNCTRKSSPSDLSETTRFVPHIISYGVIKKIIFYKYFCLDMNNLFLIKQERKLIKIRFIFY